MTPVVARNCFIAPNATVLGEVTIGEESSIWFGAVLRGDVNFIKIGHRTNIQDLSVVHVTNRQSSKAAPTVIGNEVTIGHRVIVHGCTIEDQCLIGMGAILLDGVFVGRGSVVAAGAIVTPGTYIPPGQLVMGVPAKVMRPLTPNESRSILESAENYCQLASEYREKGKVAFAV